MVIYGLQLKVICKGGRYGVYRDKIGVKAFICHGWYHFIRIHETIFQDLYWELFIRFSLKRTVGACSIIKLEGCHVLVVSVSWSFFWRFTLLGRYLVLTLYHFYRVASSHIELSVAL